ncbi:MAG: nicotinate-nucleotide adenylyltransferase [Caldilineaceae bacterium]
MPSANDAAASYCAGQNRRAPVADTRIGIFGGTFDPIHLGHLILAEEALYQLKLDRIYLVPAGDPPHKQDRTITPVEHRIRMAELATVDSPALWISHIDANRPGPHYSVDMVRLLRQAVGEQATFFFLMGLDSLRDLPAWHQPQALMALVKIVVFTRPTITIEWPTIEQALPGLQDQVLLLKMPALEISSSTLRQRIQNGDPTRFQVPQPVAAYIQKHGLYC